MKYVRIEGSKKLSSFVEPMKAQLSDLPAFDNKGWVFEIKWDGYRAIAETGKEPRLYSRNGLTFDKAYSKIFEALKKIKLESIIDGEIVVFDEHGKPSFQKLQNYKNTDRYTIQYMVFDCIELKGKRVTHLPLLKRKELLKEMLPASDYVRYCDHVEEEGKSFYQQAEKMGLEGIIAKKSDSTYQTGKRSSEWLKIKNIKGQEAIIVGFTAPKGTRNYFGSLLLAVRKNGKLVSIGNVGTGFTERSLKELHEKLKKIQRKASPLDGPLSGVSDVTWVEPNLVCNISFTEITEEGSVRHPVFQGLRVDKSAGAVILEKDKTAKK